MHARISNQLTAFTRNRLPGRSLVDHEYGDVTAIGQRHILPTAATRTVAKPQTLLERSAGQPIHPRRAHPTGPVVPRPRHL